VDDQGFDFQRVPAQKREPKRFEPPPWERAAFEELRKASEGAQAATTQAVSSPEREQTPAREDTDGEFVQREERGGESGPSEAEIIELLAGLAEEEPDARAPAMVVTVGSAAILAPIGLVLVLWGMAAMVKAGAATSGAGIARTGAVILLLFGAGFIGAAFWLVYRLMKQRGVL
jgi:hypothetical protein